MAATGGVLILVLALALIDQRFRDRFVPGVGGASGADLATVGEQVNYVAMAMALMVAQFFRGQLIEQTHLVVFTVTAVVLVILLMRL
ncbi:MAG: hypothetical protein ACRELX_00640 [Longimicrobiales bacterium]